VRKVGPFIILVDESLRINRIQKSQREDSTKAMSTGGGDHADVRRRVNTNCIVHNLPILGGVLSLPPDLSNNGCVQSKSYHD